MNVRSLLVILAVAASITSLCAGCSPKSQTAQTPTSGANKPAANTKAAEFLGKDAANHSGPRPPGGWDRARR